MNEAPPVVYPVGRTRLLARALAMCWGLGASMLFLICFLYFPVGARPLITIFMIAVLLLTGAALVAWWRGQVWSSLGWDGERWQLGAEQAGAVEDIACIEVALDAQRALLLRYRTGARSIWLWAQASSDPARWHQFRCALYSRAGHPAAELSPGAPA